MVLITPYPVKQYPHIMKYDVEVPASQDGNGNWIPGTKVTRSVECRAAIQGSNAQVKGVDGTMINCSWIIYMPLNVPDLKEGTNVRIEGKLVDTVKQFSRGLLNCRAWL